MTFGLSHNIIISNMDIMTKQEKVSIGTSGTV